MTKNEWFYIPVHLKKLFTISKYFFLMEARWNFIDLDISRFRLPLSAKDYENTYVLKLLVEELLQLEIRRMTSILMRVSYFSIPLLCFLSLSVLSIQNTLSLKT